MIISVNWLKQFTQIDASIDELAEVIGARLVEIEDVTALGGKYKDVVVVRVAECAPVPDSDHLNLTKVDDGGVVTDVERDENGLVQVVCGAPNVHAGMLAGWLPPATVVPETYGEAEPFVLGARKLRGFMSNGMLASARELDLFDDHEGIVDIDKAVAPGTPFMAAYGLDDYLLDIENKSLTHRPDTFGVVGFAREVAAIAGRGFSAPTWLESLAPAYGDPIDHNELSASIDNPELASRYQIALLGNLNENARTPLEVQTYLARSGVRPISPIVDVTNYLMLLTGQPLHAFDYDKVVALAGSSHIHVREGHQDETLALLDGRTVALSSDDIVIAAGERAIALAGAMGGLETEIDASTTKIIVESASFNLYNLRRTQMRHGIFSEAITRFTKGQPAALTAPVLARAIALLSEWCGARLIADVVDDYPVKVDEPTLTLPIGRVNDVLGSRFSVDDAAELLRNVEFIVETEADSIVVTPPYWRTDIHIGEDLIEEIGRLSGYDLIEPTLPLRDFTATSPDAGQQLREQVRLRLQAAGANEILTYNFVHGDLLRRAGQSADNAYALDNALSPDLQYYRLSITPSLLDKVSPNLRQKFDEFALFEFGKTHQKDRVDEAESDLPAEHARLAFTYAANAKRAAGRGAAYYTAKRYLEYVLDGLHVGDVRFFPLASSDVPTRIDDAAAAPFEPKRSAEVYVGETYVGVVGEYKQSVQKGFKLPQFCAGFEVDTAVMQDVAKPTGAYVPLSRFPSSDSDITFMVPTDVPYQNLADAVSDAIAAQPLAITSEPIDMYAPADGASTNITIRLTIVSYETTLIRDDVNAVTEAVASSVVKSLPGTTVI